MHHFEPHCHNKELNQGSDSHFTVNFRRAEVYVLSLPPHRGIQTQLIATPELHNSQPLD